MGLGPPFTTILKVTATAAVMPSTGSVSGSELEPKLDYQPGIRKYSKENMHTDWLKIVLLLKRL